MNISKSSPFAGEYDRWCALSDELINETSDPLVLKVIGAASGAMAELHDQIARLEREKAQGRMSRDG